MAKDTLKKIVDLFDGEVFLKCDGFDDCVIGCCFDKDVPRLMYSKKKMMAKMVKQGMTKEQAIEYFVFNIEDGYVGEKKPLFCEDEFID